MTAPPLASRVCTNVGPVESKRAKELRLNHYFPGERSADIVMRIGEHRQAESLRRRRALYWEEALASFAALAPFTASPPPAGEARVVVRPAA